ncbi:AMP-binding protein [Ancylobacter lacus]|uniref:AMP-binding protein n=1 Tax=Ancylobacter lacus TaxID=2579970 RepID=UPI001BCD8CFF|nr:AMP-binding protein [Ancylobacter lacus]
MPATLGAALPALADAAPDRVALVCDGEAMDRRTLVAAVAARAGFLAAATPPGAGIGLALPNGPELALAFLACAVAGRQGLVYDTGWPAPYRAAIEAALAPPLTLSGGERFAPAPGWPAPPAPEAAFYVGFTSGSTGMPKGYRRSHRSWIESFAVSEAEFGLSPADVVLAPGGLAASLHLYGLVHALHIGAEAVMMRRFHPRRALRLIAVRGVTALYATPTQLQMLAEAGAGRALGSVRLIMTSGAKWQPAGRAAVERLFPRAALAEFYGASELSFVTVALPGEDVPAGSVGRAARGVELAIRDAAGRDLPPGAVGAVWVRSGMLFQDYACGGEPIARRDGWMSVGDHGALDPRGFLTLHGREKRMLVTAGLNVYPEEVEAVLAGAPGVAEAVVFGRADGLRGVELVAAVRAVAAPGTNGPDIAALRAHCRARLPGAKVPRRFVLMEAFPRTAGGKADLPALRDAVEARLARGEGAA